MNYNRVVKVLVKDNDSDLFQVCRDILMTDDIKYRYMAICEDKQGKVHLYSLDDIQFVDEDAWNLIREFEYELEPIGEDMLETIVENSNGHFWCYDRKGNPMEIIRVSEEDMLDADILETVKETLYYTSESDVCRAKCLYWRSYNGRYSLPPQSP